MEVNMMTTDKVMQMARKHLGKGQMESSARVALHDAVNLRERGLLDYAKRRALASLAYSVGVLHSDYKKANAS
jgi:hypothetical protein